MSSKPIYSLQIKGLPSVSGSGDSRPWALDVYGMHDNYFDPVADSDTGALGPPQLGIGDSDTGRYTPCMVPTVARLQYYNTGTDRWKRLAGDGNGIDVNVVNQASVSVFNLPSQVVGGFTQSQVTVPAASTLVASASGATSYLRIDVVAGVGNLWVNLAGGAAVVGQGVLVTPTSPLVMEWPTAPNTDIFAIATVLNTVANISIRN